MNWRCATVAGLLWCGITSLDVARAQSDSGVQTTSGAASGNIGALSSRRVELDWTAPSTCPTHADVEREIQRLLAQSADRHTIEVGMVVTVGRDDVYELRVNLRAPVAGNRALEHTDCGAVTRAAALVIALSIDADAVAVLDERSPPAVELASPAVATDPASKPAAPPQAPAQPSVVDLDDAPRADALGSRESTFAPHVSLGAHVEATLSPGAAFGPVIAGGIGNEWFLLDLGVGGIPGHTVDLQDTDVGAMFEYLFVELDVCAGMLRKVVNVALCLAGREYWIRASGRGVDEVLKPTTAVFAMAAGPMLALELGSWSVVGTLHGVVPLSRPSFVVDNLEATVFRPAEVGLSGRVALSLRL